MRKSKSRIVPLLLILMAYAGLSFYQLHLPGLHYDEAFEAVPAMQLIIGQPVAAFRDAALTLGLYQLPLMTQDYIGAVNTYAALPFIALLGSTPVALRTMTVITGGLTLLFTCAVAYRLTKKYWVGLAAALILSVDPTFIFWNRQGIFVTAVTATIGLTATYCWLRRFDSGLKRWSITGAFLVGLGIYAKFLFVWLVAALIGAVILLNLDWFIYRRAEVTPKLKQLSPGELSAALLAFLVGCSPLLVYNLQTGGTFLNIAQNAGTSYYGVNNLAFGPNLLERLSQFIVLLNGSHLWYLGDIATNLWPLLVFGVVLASVVTLATRNALTDSPISQSMWKTAFFPFLVIALVILFSIGTVSALWVTHFAILMPWPALAMAVGGWFIVAQTTKAATAIIRAVMLAGIGLLVITNLFSTIRYHQALTESGGLSSHSDAVYDLSAWLSKNATGPVIAMDWGLAAPVTYLTHGQVTATEIFGYTWHSDVQLTERLTGSIQQSGAFYLWRSPDEIIFDRSDDFRALYRPLNLEETIQEAFYERSGRPILGVTSLVEKGTASNPPVED